MTLAAYRRKRNFRRTAEPQGKRSKVRRKVLQFVVQKHAASRLHYDFRLELNGVLKSWAIPKGPCLDSTVKRLAVQVEDHPLEYATFEGSIPKGQYGAGEVIVWDRGTWQPLGDPEAGLGRGKLEFELAGEKLQGRWLLLRLAGAKSDGGKNWLLVKRRDKATKPLDKFDIAERLPESVKTGRRLEELRSLVSPAKAKPTSLRPKNTRTQSRADPLPRSIDVQLATLVGQPPEGMGWLHELKFDGYRLVARLGDGKAQLFTRNHLDWTDRYPPIAAALDQLDVESAILDGELVVQLESGVTSFQALQNALKNTTSDQLVYYVFDLLYLNGHDLRSQPLVDRKSLLQELLANVHPQLQFSEHWEGSGSQFLRECCRRGLEGIVSKRGDRPYSAGRTTDWLKLKCLLREELVISGFTESPARHRDFGALLLGYFRDKELFYAGRVGTGFDSKLLAELRQRLNKLKTDRSPFAAIPPREKTSGVHWVQPRLVAQIAFGGWTSGGILRHPSFQGLREDKRATDVKRPESLPTEPSTSSEEPMNRIRSRKTARRAQTTSPAYLPVRLTHPDRILFPETGLTKRGLAEYYAAIADWILPHLANRPLSMLRCPEGRAGTCFFQKHAAAGTPEALRRIEIQEKSAVETYLIADDLAGLLSLTQMSILEIHPWGSRGDRLEQPDRLIFDLDPGPGVPWKEVVRAAFDLRDSLEQIDLQSFVKTTGGKGLHIVVPLSPRRVDWEEAKMFARSVAEHFAAEQPRRFVATMSKAQRQGKIFIDYLRNDRGATAVAPYSTRAKPGAPVSCPVAWDELSARLHSDAFTVANVPPRLGSLKNDPWEGFFEVKQHLPKARARRNR